MKALDGRKLFYFMASLGAVSFAVYYGYTVFSKSTYLDFLIWNLFLAWLPFVASSAASRLNRRRAYRGVFVTTWVLGIAWLLFFPNAPYLLTDLIHLTVMKDMYTLKGHWTFSYWYAFVVIFLFSWQGLLLGFISAYQFQYVIRQRTGAFLSWLFVASSSALAGYGIMLGREYRLNSWDWLMNSTSFYWLIRESLKLRTLPYSLGFGLLLFIIYITFYGLLNQSWTAAKQQTAASDRAME